MKGAHEVCSFEKSNFHLKSICQKVRLNLWQLGLLDFGRTRKYFQQLSKPNREIQNTPLASTGLLLLKIEMQLLRIIVFFLKEVKEDLHRALTIRFDLLYLESHLHPPSTHAPSL